MRPAKACHVCGNTDTVRAHLFPRALQHDIRKEAKHVLRIGAGDARPRALQSGDWRDDILCAQHEAALGEADKYGVEFCRSIDRESMIHTEGKAIAVPNPSPSLLIRFVHAVIWRHAAALDARGKGHWLGPYHRRIQEVVFGGRAPLDGYASHPGHMSNGHPVLLGLNPCPLRMGNLRLVRFDIGGLSFHLKTDNRSFGSEFRFAALERDPLVIVTMPPVDIGENPHILAVADTALRGGQLGRVRN